MKSLGLALLETLKPRYFGKRAQGMGGFKPCCLPIYGKGVIFVTFHLTVQFSAPIFFEKKREQTNVPVLILHLFLHLQLSGKRPNVCWIHLRRLRQIVN
jgi:hypothetical protein